MKRAEALLPARINYRAQVGSLPATALSPWERNSLRQHLISRSTDPATAPNGVPGGAAADMETAGATGSGSRPQGKWLLDWADICDVVLVAMPDSGKEVNLSMALRGDPAIRVEAEERVRTEHKAEGASSGRGALGRGGNPASDDEDMDLSSLSTEGGRKGIEYVYC